MISSRLESEQEILAACEKAMRIAPADFLPTLPTSKELLGQPEWYPFEHEAWPIGESIRRAFVNYPKFKKCDDILAKVVEVATYRNLRRGRQSFIMALGFVSARPYADRLAAFLHDPDVDGHVLDTLIKMKAPGHAREVKSLLQADKTWIRNLAKKYLDRYPNPS
jgi:hypothetical protein